MSTEDNVINIIIPTFLSSQWSGCPVNQNINLRTTQFCSVGTNRLELTASIVPWRNPDTRTIPTQTENVAVPFGLRAWFDCVLWLSKAVRAAHYKWTELNWKLLVIIQGSRQTAAACQFCGINVCWRSPNVTRTASRRNRKMHWWLCCASRGILRSRMKFAGNWRALNAGTNRPRSRWTSPSHLRCWPSTWNDDDNNNNKNNKINNCSNNYEEFWFLFALWFPVNDTGQLSASIRFLFIWKCGRLTKADL